MTTLTRVDIYRLLTLAHNVVCTCYCTSYYSIYNAGVLSTAAGVTRDQAEADTDMSIQQRLILAGGSTLEGVSEMVDNDILADTLEVAGIYSSKYTTILLLYTQKRERPLCVSFLVVLTSIYNLIPTMQQNLYKMYKVHACYNIYKL